jgi:DNA repair exonuclease SbcCD ATPase subunit
MEITLEGIVALITLFIGGSGIGGLVTWRWLKKKAKAEADQAAAEAKQKEAEAKSAEVEIAQKIQDTYQEMLEDKQKEVADNQRLIAELREDRDHYKQGYVEMRSEVEKLTKDFYDFKRETMEERQKMKNDIARNTRIAETSRPFMCGLAPDCPKCVPVIISDEGTVKPKGKRSQKHDIEPIND